ncbi:MAG: hypothetical protein J3R72DRAFT_417407 [Linnemannia gamsii]|nr:MAG: hypothetical protein J3R72DRAFT_417407 [Linnemannia gamsii]
MNPLPTATVPAAGNATIRTSNGPLNPLQPELVQDSNESNDKVDENEIGDDSEFDDPNIRESMNDTCRAAAVARRKAAKEENDKEDSTIEDLLNPLEEDVIDKEQVAKPFRHLEERVKEVVQEETLKYVRNLLNRDQVIVDAARYYGISQDERLIWRTKIMKDKGVVREVERVQFYVPCHRFNEWREKHAKEISTNFVHHQTTLSRAKKEAEGTEKEKKDLKRRKKKRERGGEGDPIDVDGVDESELVLKGTKGEIKAGVKRKYKAGIKGKSKGGVEGEALVDVEDEVKTDVEVKPNNKSNVKADGDAKGEIAGGAKVNVEGETSHAEPIFKHEEEQPGQFVRRIFFCQRRGNTRVHKFRVKGGKDNKPRNVKAEMRVGCKSAFCYYVEAMPNKEHAFRVVYDVDHNHTFGSHTNLGSRQLSKVVKSTIRSLLTQGSTIHDVMLQLTMDHDKFTAVLGGNGEQLSRDQFITYDDVYNIWYDIAMKKLRKDPDQTTAAIL